MALFNSSLISRYSFYGKDIACAVCGHDVFFQKDIPVQEGQRVLFGIDEVKGDLICLICDVCGYILWFYQDGAEISSQEGEEVRKVLPVAEDDYEKYVLQLDEKGVKDILANIDKEAFPRKYRILKQRLEKGFDDLLPPEEDNEHLKATPRAE